MLLSTFCHPCCGETSDELKKPPREQNRKKTTSEGACASTQYKHQKSQAHDESVHVSVPSRAQRYRMPKTSNTYSKPTTNRREAGYGLAIPKAWTIRAACRSLQKRIGFKTKIAASQHITHVRSRKQLCVLRREARGSRAEGSAWAACAMGSPPPASSSSGRKGRL